jgi:copper oxidase (laccase) domain-containing protein
LYLDLALETKRQLIEAGLKAQNIGASAGCTCHNESDYYSFRRQKQVSRMLALLSLDQWPS